MPTTRKDEGALLVELSSDALESFDGLQRAADALVEAGRRTKRLVVDLSRLRHVSAALLTVLLRARADMGARPGDFVVVADGLQREVFAVTRLDRLFVLAASAEEAVRAAWPEPEPNVVG